MSELAALELSQIEVTDKIRTSARRRVRLPRRAPPT